MDLRTAGDVLSAVALAIALAACAGLRAWLPLFLAGVLARVGLLQLGSSFHFLSSNRALILFGVASLIEMAADKIPVVDHALDGLSTFLRPLAGALIAASVLGRVSDPLVAVAAGAMVGVPSALVPHAAKSGLRALSTSMTAGLANPFVSFLEDGATVLLVLAAVLIPLVVVAFLGVLCALVFSRIARRRRQAAQAA
jgi:hypothetical protein